MAQRVKKAVKMPVGTAADDHKGGATMEAGGALQSSTRTSVRGTNAPTARRSLSKGDQTGTVEAERDALKSALEAANARIRALEAAQAQVANRIGWMIEALQTLRDEGR